MTSHDTQLSAGASTAGIGRVANVVIAGAPKAGTTDYDPRTRVGYDTAWNRTGARRSVISQPALAAGV